MPPAPIHGDDAVAARGASDQFARLAIDDRGGRCFEKRVGLIVSGEQGLDLLPQDPIGAAQLRDTRRAPFGIEDDGRIEDHFDARPGVRRDRHVSDSR